MSTTINRRHGRPTIGVLISQSTHKNDRSMWQGLVDEAQKRDVNVICFVGLWLRSPYEFEAQANVIYDLVSAEKLDGLVIMAGAITQFLPFEEKRAFFECYRPLPIVTLDCEIPGIPNIYVDSRQNMRKVMLHLIQTHHYKRIALIRGPDTSQVANDRYDAYVETLAECDLPFDSALVTPPLNWFHGRQGLAWLLEHGGDFEAVAAANDDLAIGAIEELQARGIRVPDQVAVVGYDDAAQSRWLNPPLTTMPIETYKWGQQALATILDLLAGKPVPKKVAIQPELVVRQSCGCIDAVAGQVNLKPAVSLPKAAGKTKSVKSILLNRHDDILAAVQQTAEKETCQVKPGQIAQLLDAFITELSRASSDGFARTLHQILRQAADNGDDLEYWHQVVSALRLETAPYLRNAETLRQAENLWQQARLLVGRTVQHLQGYKEMLAEQRMGVLREIGAALITTVDIEGLMNVLAHQLPRLNIPGAYLALYENPQQPTGQARLLFAYNEQGRIELESGGKVFPSFQLVPENLWFDERCHSLVALPLYFREEQMGFVLFEANPQDGPMYEALRAQISSALQGALLVQRVQERSAELARQQYIVDSFMENVPDSIYFKDRDSRITKANRAHAAYFGLDDPAEEIGKTDFDFFPAGLAQPRYDQEQEIIRTGAVLNREETDGKGHWSLVTKMPLRDEQGQVMGTFGITRDITDLVKAKQAAEMAKDEAEKARRAAEIEKERAEQSREEAEKARQESEVANRTLAAQMWQTTGQAMLNERIRGEQDVTTLAGNVVQQLCEYLNAQRGMLYIALDNNTLTLQGTYAYRRKEQVEKFQFGESLIGQAAITKRPLTIHLPDDMLVSPSSAGEISPRRFVVAPLVYEGQTVGVVELGTLTDFSPAQMEFIDRALEGIAIAFTTAQARARVNELLAQTQQQAEVLQAQEEELRAANEELEAQTESLRESQDKLQANQADLEAANAELEEKAQALQEQRAAVDRQNQDLKLAQQELERKATELTLASRYKSEFLANMSHELRTPLNSLLILAGMLAKNEEGNLTSDQVESAQIIQSGGADLLNLINDILDLSKVEAGKMEFRFAPVSLERLTTVMRAQFGHVAESKGVEFKITVAEDAPTTFESDQQRVEQIIKNMLSNAFKFTAQGEVGLDIYRPGAETDLRQSGLKPGEALAISVRDTGIGMTPEQQKIVFEAFQQADGSTSREYGGTGLGLAISRELALKLGGQIELMSEKGQGSTFTLYLPVGKPASTGQAAPTAAPSRAHKSPVKAATLSASPATLPPALLPDDRDNLQPNDHILLVVEDDAKFAKVTYDYAHKKGFKCLLAGDGESGLRLVKTHPVNAIILDLNLPGMSGWEVLDALKNDSDTRHIPVHIMSVADEDMDAYKRGAMGFLSKPISQDNLDDAFQRIEQFISRKIKTLLLVEDDTNLRKSVRKLLEGSDVVISEAGLGQTALAQLASQPFDCMILDLSLPDMSGFELLSRLDSEEKLSKCPVIVYTGKALSEEENHELLKYADSVIVKGVKSPERLLDETALFLHRVVADLPEDKQRTIKRLHDKETVLTGKTVLIVDDDARNAFALNKLLADKGLKVHIAINGQKAIDFLDKTMVDLVLMDIMMPGMDGYEVMKRIRSQPRFRRLPILALTAKAMKGDREKCIAAGASDYLAKPIDTDRLFSMLRVWLSRE